MSAVLSDSTITDVLPRGEAANEPGTALALNTPSIGGAIGALSKVNAGIAALHEKYLGVVYDVSTGKGLDEAKAARVEIRAIRYQIEPTVKATKAAWKVATAQLDVEAARIVAELMKVEKPIHDQITAEEEKKAAEKVIRDALAAEAKLRTDTALEAMRGALVQAVGKTATEIVLLMEGVAAVVVNIEAFGADAGECKQVQLQTVDALTAMHAAAVLADANALELATMRAAQAENDRIASEAREAAELLVAEATEKQRIANEEAAAAVLRTQKQMADAMEAITRIQGVPALAARGVPTIDSVRAALADVLVWEPVEAAYGFLFAPATLAKSTAIAQLQALEQKVREEELAAAALVAKAKQDADDAKAAKALADAEIATERRKQDDEAAAERVAQAARDAAAARDKAAAAVALKKAQGVAVQLLTALQGINVALEALTDAESELSCIPEGPERHALEDAWFVGRAALLAAE